MKGFQAAARGSTLQQCSRRSCENHAKIAQGAADTFLEVFNDA